MAGILTRPGARRDHAVVAGQLPLDAQAPRNPPRGRMEPVHRAGRKRQRLREAIVAVRRAPAREGPRRGAGPPARCRPWQESGSRAGVCRRPSACCARGFEADGPAGGRPGWPRTHSPAASNPCPAPRSPRARTAGRSTVASPGDISMTSTPAAYTPPITVGVESVSGDRRGRTGLDSARVGTAAATGADASPAPRDADGRAGAAGSSTPSTTGPSLPPCGSPPPTPAARATGAEAGAPRRWRRVQTRWRIAADARR